MIEGVATFWTAETPYNVSIELHASEGANAQLYMELCAKAEIPRSLVNAMLTENVRKSLGHFLFGNVYDVVEIKEGDT